SGTRPDFNITTFARETLPAYTLVNLTAGYHFRQAFAINLRIENLGDSDYQIADGYNTPGRSAYAELRYQL
ncbi:MAG: TonB-dependent receptor, partial [Gammaproteobacteria bacterium]